MNNAELLELYKQYQVNKSPAIRDQIICAYMPLATIVAKRLKKTLYLEDFDDLQSDGYLGIIKAIDNYDLSKANKVNAYIATKIYGAIIDGVRHRNKYKRYKCKNYFRPEVVSYEDHANEIENMIYKEKVEDIVDVIFNADLIKYGMQFLCEKDRKIIWLYFYKQMTLDDIGDMLGISGSRVNQRKKRALQIMKMELNKEGYT